MPIAILGLGIGAICLWLAWRARRVQAALRASAHQAEEERAAMSRLLASAGHDLRQPLQVMTLHISLLDSHLASDAGRQFLGTMDGAVRSMTHTIAALLALARLQEGESAPEVAELFLEDLFRDVAALCVDANEGGTVDIGAAPEAQVRADPEILEIILCGLVSHVANRSRNGRATLEGRRLAAGVGIDVHGEGPGAAEIWAAGPAGGDVGLEGVDFGLSVVGRLARRLGYPLSMRVLPGGGEAFRLLLPAN